MKNQIKLLLILCFISISSYSQNIYFTDTNFKNALLNHSPKIDGNGDNEISKNEARTVTRLNLNNKSISNLEGIEYFENLEVLKCSNNNITKINTSTLSKLRFLIAENNQISTIDVRNCMLWTLRLTGNPLEYAYLEGRNTFQMEGGYGISFDLDKIKYVCIGKEQYENDVTNVRDSQLWSRLGNKLHFGCANNSYEIKGIISYDANGNGCDSNDTKVNNFRINITNSLGQGATIFSNTSGIYSYLTKQEGNYFVSPDFNNYYTVNPGFSSATLNSNNNTAQVDFCLRPNGIHKDLDIIIISSRARPGSLVSYKIIYRNKGNQIQNGEIKLTYENNKQRFENSSLPVSSSTTNSKSWQFQNLKPFETRELKVSFKINLPTGQNSVNSGDYLNYEVSISNNNDETPDDNTFTLSQEVRNSWDPNDKTCLEGAVIRPEQIGKYLHYMIRFENKGTANALNIKVKDILDASKFDIKTFEPIHGSHPFITKRTNNEVEFIFNNINLPFDDANNDGYVLFRVKTKSTLREGNVIKNKASIYFDFNAPIVTNTAKTIVKKEEIETPSVSTYFDLFPNPTSGILNIKPKSSKVKVQLIFIYNKYGNITAVFPGFLQIVYLNFLKPDIYFVKLQTNIGLLTSKAIVKK